jgi:acyl-coenzyme A thioesterase PaaI-like protein
MSDLSNLSIKFNSPHKDVEEFYNNSIQLKYYNCEVEFISDNLLLVKIPTITSIHQGGVGANAVNGGVISYLFDLALGMTSYLVKVECNLLERR